MNPKDRLAHWALRRQADLRTLGPAGDVAPVRGADIASPCINVCRIDKRLAWCVGCYRTIGEIADWSAMSNPQKQAVRDALRARRVQARTQPGTREDER
jgi:hypothetical protein